MKRRNRKGTSGAIYFPMIVINLLCHSWRTTQESLCNTIMHNTKKQVIFPGGKKICCPHDCFSSPLKNYHVPFPPEVKKVPKPCGTQWHDGTQVEATVSTSVSCPNCVSRTRLHNSSLKPFCVTGLALSSTRGANHVAYTSTGSMFQCLWNDTGTWWAR